MSRVRWLSPLLVILLAGALLAGCGDDDSSDTKAKDSTSQTTVAKDESADADVTVKMREYAFEVSGKLKSGGTIRLTNDGNELHMMGIGKLKPGVTLDQVRDAIAKAGPNAQGDPTADLIEQQPQIGWPGGIVSPGHSVTLSAGDLAPGTYGLICFLPTEGGGGPHVLRGMLNKLEVEQGTTTKVAKPDATYKVTVGKPIEGPATLEAGTRTIEVTGDGNIGPQEPQLVKAKSADQSPDALNTEINKYFGQFDSEAGPEKGAGKKIAEYIAFSAFDINGNKSVTFVYDFEPGTYYLAAPDTDNDSGPGKVPTEIIKITVK